MAIFEGIGRDALAAHGSEPFQAKG